LTSALIDFDPEDLNQSLDQLLRAGIDKNLLMVLIANCSRYGNKSLKANLH